MASGASGSFAWVRVALTLFRRVQNTHAIGDRANKIVLDIYEGVLARANETGGRGVDEWRPRIEHAQIMTQADLERVGRLGGRSFFRVPRSTFLTAVGSYSERAANTRVSTLRV